VSAPLVPHKDFSLCKILLEMALILAPRTGLEPVT
jgi:hypothetical protein